MPAIDASQIALLVALVAVLQTVALVVGGIVIWRQLRESRRERELSAILHLFDDLGSRAAYEDGDTALGLPARIEEYTPEELELATWMVRVYEKLGFLVESGSLPPRRIIPLYSRRIIWTWDALQPFIQEQRRLRDSDGAYRIGGDGRYFEELTKRALMYRERTFKASPRVHPAVPVAYRERVRETIARGERLGSGGYRG
ncbi:MAG TPA: hypothetical protein VF808_17505 [Ktedonobacterales bacterium]